ncbi:ArsR/SmtB family transcription factor [Streptosporangium saharense]|uniref:DNA-binding transcriptional ArsR family regulator n=1 Tax=Streptosporangium saharense TaxID=1706840 RepID=A0A7W7QUA0_9ACTN|nr:winged helix-turn-helix domain-containing protein [Streptosporangium saharense]MBB4919867.1 DNA-binding transcriptional ArsR family regulator [Streptosporangium saharense]
MSISPNLTALAVIADALAGRRRGLPERWRRAVQESVGPRAREAVRPLGAPGYSVVPDSVVPQTPIEGFSVTSQAELLRAVPEEQLTADLEQVFGGGVPEHWRPAADRPKRWFAGYAAALEDVWDVTGPLWERASSLLDREVERVGTAVVRGGLDVLLSSLSERIQYGEDGLLIADLEPSRYDLGDRKMILVPMLAGRDAVIVKLDHPEVVWIAYPVPGAETLWRERDPRAADELAALIGPVRAALLHTLDRPATMSALASGAGMVPSAITYHCERLVAAGLVSRERRGREVWIVRTRRGEELLDLFRH